MKNTTIPFGHFDLLRNFCQEFGLDFNAIYNGVNVMYKKKYVIDNQVHTLADVPKEAFLEVLYTFKNNNLFGSVGANLYIRPILLPVNNQLWASPVVNGSIISAMLKSNHVYSSAFIGLIKDGDRFSVSYDEIVHTKPACEPGASCTKNSLCSNCSERLEKPITGGYMQVTLHDGQRINHFISREVINEAIYRTNELAFGGLVEEADEEFVLSEAIFFSHLGDMGFYLSKLGKTTLLHKINKILSFKAKLIDKRTRIAEQAVFLRHNSDGCHDRVMFKINAQYN